MVYEESLEFHPEEDDDDSAEDEKWQYWQESNIWYQVNLFKMIQNLSNFQKWFLVN